MIFLTGGRARPRARKGIPGGPGKIIVAFRWCTCVGDEPDNGNTVVYCQVDGCQYRGTRRRTIPASGLSITTPHSEPGTRTRLRQGRLGRQTVIGVAAQIAADG
jgi:hypothetical protein